MGSIACMVMLQAGLALAENRADTFTLSPYVGGYTFQSKQNIETGPVVGGRLGYNITENWAVEAVVDYVRANKSNNISGHAEKLRYGGDLLYNFMPKSSLVPYLAAGFGGMDLRDAGVNTTMRGVANYGGGVKWFFADFAAIRADVRGLNYSIGDLKTNVQYTLGLHLALAAPKEAPKPIQPEPVKEMEKPKTAPVVVPPAPTANLSATPGAIEAGKSSVLSWDSKNATSCEILPGIGQVSTNGSKEITPAADVVYTLNCKGDGGFTSSTANVAVTQPPPKIVEAAGKKASAVAAGARLILKVQFDTGKSIIKKQYYDELKVVGDGLNEHKNLKGVIEGHTDSVGSDASNKALSQRRANAVRDYIVKNFKIDRKRLAAKGYGESKPIADNATVEGRAQNRRIEATFEEIPNFKPDAEEAAAPAKKAKKAVKKKAVKKAPAKK